jgi:hypothetical protein
MRVRLWLILALFLLPRDLVAQEAITLTTPIARPSINTYAPAELNIQVLPVPRITVIIVHVASGVREAFSYPCPPPCVNSTDAQVSTLITALNTANLSTRSLWRRVFDRLVLDFPTRFVGGATVN